MSGLAYILCEALSGGPLQLIQAFLCFIFVLFA